MNAINTLTSLTRLPCIALATLVLTACASSTPAWIDNPAAHYAAKQYLSAVGEADQRPAAADRALANLAKIFEVAVSESSLDFSSASVSSDGDSSQTNNEQRLSRTVSTEAKQIVAGARVVEYHQNEQGRIYALAVLDKASAASRFRQSILAADREVDSLLGYANQQAPNPVAALNALNRARLAQMQRDQLQSNLLVVADGKGINTPHDSAAIEDTIRQALATLRCGIDADDPSVKMELQRAVSQLGIQIDPAAALRFTGLMDTTAPEKKQGWFWIRGSYELILADGDTVLAKQRWPVKASATSEALVGQRLRDTVNQQLPGQVFEMLTTVEDK